MLGRALTWNLESLHQWQYLKTQSWDRTGKTVDISRHSWEHHCPATWESMARSLLQNPRGNREFFLCQGFVAALLPGEQWLTCHICASIPKTQEGKNLWIINVVRLKSATEMTFTAPWRMTLEIDHTAEVWASQEPMECQVRCQRRQASPHPTLHIRAAGKARAYKAICQISYAHGRGAGFLLQMMDTEVRFRCCFHGHSQEGRNTS